MRRRPRRAAWPSRTLVPTAPACRRPTPRSPWCVAATPWSTPSTGRSRYRPCTVPGGGGGPPPSPTTTATACRSSASRVRRFYTVFDIDCTTTPRPSGTCQNTNGATTRPERLGPARRACSGRVALRTSPRNITGSSVFDFEDDGEGRGRLRRRVLRARLRRHQWPRALQPVLVRRAPGTRTRSWPTSTATSAPIW